VISFSLPVLINTRFVLVGPPARRATKHPRHPKKHSFWHIYTAASFGIYDRTQTHKNVFFSRRYSYVRILYTHNNSTDSFVLHTTHTKKVSRTFFFETGKKNGSQRERERERERERSSRHHISSHTHTGTNTCHPSIINHTHGTYMVSLYEITQTQPYTFIFQEGRYSYVYYTHVQHSFVLHTTQSKKFETGKNGSQREREREK
jgi:hypothetical protein